MRLMGRNEFVAGSIEDYVLPMMQNGGEVIFVDNDLTTHAIRIDDSGTVAEHVSYEGSPGAVIPQIAEAVEHGIDLTEIDGLPAYRHL